VPPTVGELDDEAAREALIARLDPETRQAVQRLIGYPANTAGSLMTTEFVAVTTEWTVGQALQHVREVERSARPSTPCTCSTRPAARWCRWSPCAA
jgi:Mg/Co/Ni transporter MgtE